MQKEIHKKYNKDHKESQDAQEKIPEYAGETVWSDHFFGFHEKDGARNQKEDNVCPSHGIFLGNHVWYQKF